MLRPRQPSFSISATRFGALRCMWLCVSMRSNEASTARTVVGAAAAANIASSSRRLVRPAARGFICRNGSAISEVELHRKLDDTRLVAIAAADVRLVDRPERGAGQGAV